MNSLTVSPNPVAAVTSLRFALSNPQPLVMQIADLTGRVLINKTVNGVQGENVLQIDTKKSLTNGMYIVSLLSETNELFTSKNDG